MRRPGTFTINPRIDTLTPGDTDRISLREISGGPRNQKGYLSKWAPFKAVVVDSYTSVRLKVSVNGGDKNPVPSNTARTFDSTTISSIEVTNPANSGADVKAEDVELIVFTPNSGSGNQSEISIRQFVSDTIPGVQL